ncbi:hypothetical protein BV25DRAFT_1843619 [Artomyces pyxidatus]|uniref:Uncharacterized protein n=1 Tax=Artomyces pyxidatus TaxID=48021 RepID=A0ACB8SE39_9AGAM|nr:hypothetical protein BV25DRAFT_1843619 [Artomyces pyxidatus]
MTTFKVSLTGHLSAYTGRWAPRLNLDHNREESREGKLSGRTEKRGAAAADRGLGGVSSQIQIKTRAPRRWLQTNVMRTARVNEIQRMPLYEGTRRSGTSGRRAFRGAKEARNCCSGGWKPRYALRHLNRHVTSPAGNATLTLGGLEHGVTTKAPAQIDVHTVSSAWWQEYQSEGKLRQGRRIIFYQANLPVAGLMLLGATKAREDRIYCVLLTLQTSTHVLEYTEGSRMRKVLSQLGACTTSRNVLHAPVTNGLS